ncbi:hypothetical protein BDW75DRAFT_237963 [Aspergillus navahoensis]
MSHSATNATLPNAGAAPYLDHDYASVKKFGLHGPADAITLMGEHSMEDSIIARAQSRQHTVTTLCCQDISDDSVPLAVNHAGSIGAPVAVPGIADPALRRGCYAGRLLSLNIRSHHSGMISSLDRLPARVRRCVLFCATDGDLAILLFDELVHKMQEHLADRTSLAAHTRLRATLRSATAYSHERRLISAAHISYLASTNIGVSSPGSQSGHGQKANVQDIGVHPQPALVVKAYALAAKTFANEIQELMPRLDTRAILEMTNGMNRCLQGLEALGKTLVMFPDPEYSGNVRTALTDWHNAD